MFLDDELAFATLFKGREDAQGTEYGGCVHERVTFETYRHHLDGTNGLGIYPMVYEQEEWYVWWGCVDLDVKAEHKRRWDYETSDDALIAARNLQTVLAQAGIVGFIERTKSNGFHVWVFANNKTSARSMRRALLVACEAASVPPTEVNPKAEGYDNPNTLGNYVRLPYFGGTERPILDQNNSPVSIRNFLAAAEDSLTPPSLIDDLAGVWRPLTAPTGASQGHVAPTRIPTTGGWSKRLTAVVENGPLRSEDRSGWLYFVARLCRDDNLPMDEAINIVDQCDVLYTRKFVDRPDRVRQITHTVEKAYCA